MKLSEFVRHGPKMARIVEGIEVLPTVFYIFVRTSFMLTRSNIHAGLCTTFAKRTPLSLRLVQKNGPPRPCGLRTRTTFNETPRSRSTKGKPANLRNMTTWHGKTWLGNLRKNGRNHVKTRLRKHPGSPRPVVPSKTLSTTKNTAQ